jgi:hypothetical protein
MTDHDPSSESLSDFDIEAHEQRLAEIKGQLAVRRAFEQMMQSVDAGEADRDETIAAMTNVMKKINNYGRTD